MTTEERIRLALYAAYLLAVVGVLLWVSFPQVRAKGRQSLQWARYYQWKANFETMPAWMQEAAIVRGKGPA
jgi:hypothetical protein